MGLGFTSRCNCAEKHGCWHVIFNSFCRTLFFNIGIQRVGLLLQSSLILTISMQLCIYVYMRCSCYRRKLAKDVAHSRHFTNYSYYFLKYLDTYSPPLYITTHALPPRKPRNRNSIFNLRENAPVKRHLHVVQRCKRSCYWEGR
jgi:hypothetical protein